MMLFKGCLHRPKYPTAGKQKILCLYRGYNFKWSRLPDSNRGPHPYHGCALPTELSRHRSNLNAVRAFLHKNGGRSWIWTNVGSRRQIYSLLPLTTRPSYHSILQPHEAALRKDILHDIAHLSRHLKPLSGQTHQNIFALHTILSKDQKLVLIWYISSI